MKKVKLSGHIIQQKTKLKDKELDFEPEVYGVTNKEGVVITNVPPSADLSEYILISQNQFVYNPYRINVGSIGLTPKNVIGVASPAYVVFETKETLETEYLFYYLKSSHGTKLIKYYGDKGGVRSSLSFDKLGEIEIPLPSLAEQETIVQKIKGFMATHSQAKAKIEALQTDLKAYRKSILQEAIKGNLTAAWRANNPTEKIDLKTLKKETAKKQKPLPPIKADEMPFTLPQNWSWVRLGEIAFITKLAGFEFTNYFDLKQSGEVPVVRAQNVKMNLFVEKKLLYIDKQISEYLTRSALTKRSLLMTFIGAGIGEIAIFDKTERWHLAPNVAKIEPNCSELEHLKCLLYFLMSNLGQSETFKDMKQTAQPSLSMATIRNISLPLPPLTEQAEIVRILEEKMATISAAEEQLKALLAEQSQLQKSMMQEVFRG